jgi:hypothetical protein
VRSIEGGTRVGSAGLEDAVGVQDELRELLGDARGDDDATVRLFGRGHDDSSASLGELVSFLGSSRIVRGRKLPEGGESENGIGQLVAALFQLVASIGQFAASIFQFAACNFLLENVRGELVAALDQSSASSDQLVVCLGQLVAARFQLEK